MPVYFVIIPILVLGALYSYIGWRLLSPLQLKKFVKRLAWMAVFLLAIFPMSSAFMRLTGIEGSVVDSLAWLSFISIGFTSIVFFFLLLKDLAVFMNFILARIQSLFQPVATTTVVESHLGLVGESRRNLLSKSVNLGVLGAAAVMTGTGVVEARQRFRIEKVNIPLDRITKNFDGFRIVQLSDIHVGPTIKGDFVKEIVDRANALEPDIIVITGDLVDGSVDYLKKDVEPLRNLNAKIGKYFVTGNHEYYSNVFPWIDKVRELGMDVLMNEHRVITRNNSNLVIGGVNDLRAEQIVPEHKTDAAASLAGAPKAEANILLAHQPVSVYEAEKAGYDVQLSGHTHGGQYFPFNKLINIAQPFVAGIYQYKNTCLYVNRGTGYWGPPIRIGSPAEITELSLSSSNT